MHPWKETRIRSERELMKKYGLKNHKEVWKAKTYLGKHREQARELLAKVGISNPQIKKESDQLLLHLTRMGIVSMGASLDDVLALDTESVLSRRLQTLVYLKGFSSTPYQARQLISHGHVAVKGTKVTIPSYMVGKDEESQIQYTVRSPLNEISHPARPKTDVYKAELGIPLKVTVDEKPVVITPPKQEPAAAIVAPTTQPAAVVPVPSPAEPSPSPAEPSPTPTAEPSPTSPAEKPTEEKPAKPAGKPKEHQKKEKKTEEGA